MQVLGVSKGSPGEKRRMPASGPLAGLGNRFVSLFAKRLPRLEFAAEVARALQELLRLQAVAVLGYQTRRERLVLLAAEGLGSEAIAALGSGEACVWDIPVRCLRNRRISLISGAHKNPFVPRPLAELCPRGLTLVAVPVLEGESPAGVVLLFAAGARSFADQDLYTLSQALLVCAPVFREGEDSALESAPVTIESAKAQETLRKLAAAGAIIDPAAVGPPPPRADAGAALLPEAAARPAPEWRPEERQRQQELELELENVRAELEAANARIRQLTLQNHSLLRERDDLTQRIGELEAAEEGEVARLRAELEALQDRLVAAEAERTRTARLADSRVQVLQQSLEALQKERETLESRGSNAEAQLAEWQTLALAVYDERDRLVAQIEALQNELLQQREVIARTRQSSHEALASVEADRDGWKREAQSARAALLERNREFDRIEREWRSACVQRDALAEQLAQARAELQRLQELAETFHGQFADAETARAALAAELATIRRQREEERQRWAEAEAARSAELDAARRDWEELAGAFERLQQQYREQLELNKNAEVSLESARQELARLVHEHESASAQLEAVRRERDELALRLESSERERATLEAERRALASEVAELRRQKVEQEAAQSALSARYRAEEEAWRQREAAARAALEELEKRWQEARQRAEEESARARALLERSETLERERTKLQEQLAAALSDLERVSTRLVESEEASRVWQERCTRLEERLQEELRRQEQLRAWAEEQSASLEEEKKALLEKLFALEHDLEQAALARDAARSDYQAAAEKLAELSARYEEARALLVAAEQARAAADAELGRLQIALAEERNVAESAQRALRAELQALRSEWERLHGQLPLLRARLDQEEKLRLQRDQELQDLQRAYAEVRQQLADKAVVARQADTLARRVVELEQALATAKAEAARAQTQTASEWEARVVALERELAAVRGEVEAAERARAATAEELEVLRQVHEESQVLADRKLAALRESVDRLLQERQRLEHELAESEKRIEAQRATVLELQQSAEAVRSERDRAAEQVRQLGEQLAAAQRQLEQLAQTAAQAAEEAARTRAERERLAAEVEALLREQAAARERITSAEQRAEEAAAQAQRDREVWQQALQNARAAQESLRAELERERQEFEKRISGTEVLSTRLAELERAHAEAQQRAQAAEQRLAEAEAAWRQEGRAQAERVAAFERAVNDARAEAEAARRELASWQARFEQATREQAELDRQRADLAAQIARLEEENSALRREQERLQAELQLAQASQGEQAQALGQQLQALRTRLRALEQEKALLEGSLAEHQKRTRDLAAAHAAAVGELQGLTENLRRQVAELNAGRAQLHQRLEEAQREVRSWRERAEREESERASVLERYRRLERELAQSEQRRAEMDRELQQLREQAQDWQRRASEQQALAEQLAALSARTRELDEQLATLQGELARSERQRATLEEEREERERERREFLERLAREQQRLEEQRQQLADERKRMEGLLAQQQQDFETERRSLAELRAAWARLQEEKLASDQERIELAERLEAGEERLRALEAELEQLRAALQQAQAERDELAEALRSAQETVAQLSRASGGAQMEQALARDVQEVTPTPPAQHAAVRGRGNGLAARSSEEAEPAAAPATEGGREIVLFETGQRANDASGALRAAGFEVSVRPFEESAVQSLSEGNVGYALINLGAGPAAWRTLLALRREPRCQHVKVLAYVMPANGDKGFCFGRAEFDLWPPDPARALAQLQWLRPKLRRLLAVSADVDAMGKLREPLAKANVSTSIVLDGKQALEFTSIVAPEAAVVHLGPATSGVARAIAGLRSQEGTAELPLLILLEPRPVREEQFYAATVRELLFRGSFQFSQLPAELARLLS